MSNKRPVKSIVSIEIPALGRSIRLFLHNYNETLSNIIRTRNHYEPKETSVFLSMLKPGDTVLDVGANIGWYSIIGAMKVGDLGSVISIEPENRNFALLLKNIEINSLGNITPYNLAASDVSEERILHLSTDNFGDHRLTGSGISKNVQKTRTTTLDEIVESLDAKIGLCKIDVQGWECRVLDGLRRTISIFKPFIMLEFWPEGLKLSGNSVFHIYGIIAENRYMIYRILPYGVEALEINVLHEMVKTEHMNPEAFWNLLLVHESKAAEFRNRLRT